MSWGSSPCLIFPLLTRGSRKGKEDICGRERTCVTIVGNIGGGLRYGLYMPLSLSLVSLALVSMRASKRMRANFPTLGYALAAEVSPAALTLAAWFRFDVAVSL